MSVAASFVLPRRLVATEPPEATGSPRDAVRLLIAKPDGLTHTRFDRLGAALDRGDLLVVNTSPTMPAAVNASMRGQSVGLHFATRHDDGAWTVEVRRPDHSGPVRAGKPNEILRIHRGQVRLLEPVDGADLGAVRLWRAQVDVRRGVRRFLQLHGRPIRYSHVPKPWPLRFYQTVFSDLCRWPGSAEMASAARPFTPALVAALESSGLRFAGIRLDAGVSSPESFEAPQPERFDVSPATADLVNRTHREGGRVIAVGTTVTRALETVAQPDGTVAAGHGWTDLVLSAQRPARIADGLITGWHPPEASHLRLLEAVAGPTLTTAAYTAALDDGYLWHEFGDSCLFLPG